MFQVIFLDKDFNNVLNYAVRLCKILRLMLPIAGEVFEMRVAITLACTECKNRNYQSNKNKKNDPDRIEIKKYCKFCKAQTVHKETK